MIRKLLKKGDLQWTTVRQALTLSLSLPSSHFSKQMCSKQRAYFRFKLLTAFVSSQKGFLNTSFGSMDEKEDDSNLEELDLPTDFKDLPIQIDWNAELPANIVVPRVDLHSLILDFAAVSFLDISGLKELKTVRFQEIVGIMPLIIA